MLQKFKDLKLEQTIFSFSYLILTGNKYFETLFLKITIIENASFIQFFQSQISTHGLGPDISIHPCKS